MSLPPIPKIRLEDDARTTIRNIQIGFERLRQGFANATGEAIAPPDVDSPNSGPTTGQGGSGALSIADAPTIHSLTVGSQLNATNHTQESFIDISYTKPANAVNVMVYYKESDSEVFREASATTHPYRLLHLLPNITYDIKLAGVAANNALGPASSTTSVTTTAESSEVAPTDAHYVVTASHDELANEHELQGESTVIRIDVTDDAAVVNVENLGITTAKLADNAVTTVKILDANVTTVKIADLNITTAKLADNNVTTAKRQANLLTQNAVSLTGTGAASELIAQNFTIGHSLGKAPMVMPVLFGLGGESATARFTGTFAIGSDAINITVRVVGAFFGSTATITCTLRTYYW